MLALQNQMLETQDFLIGVELVTTRGAMEQEAAVRTRCFASELVYCDRVDWVSITDNAGGNPTLGPMALGKPILYGGKEVVIHLSCKDYNRHGLESEAWQLASEGFHNILSLSGDYPAEGYKGSAKPVFDIDSVGLLTLLSDMNRGVAGSKNKQPAVSPDDRERNGTSFFTGAVATNFKLHENEVMPQYYKMEKKLQAGAKYIIGQIGYDSRKSHEMLLYLASRGFSDVPLIGNVFVLTLPTARFFRTLKIPGVVISDALWVECERYGGGRDKGRQFFLELAAKQVAIFRGLGFRGAYLGGVHSAKATRDVLDLAESYGEDDWREFAREVSYSRPGEFFLYDQDRETGLATPNQLEPSYKASLAFPRSKRKVTLHYRMGKFVHGLMFTPGKRLYKWARNIYARARNQKQGPVMLRVIEHASKSMLFGCHDCGDCSLPDIAYLCPESQCAKNQRNGPCGGTRDGKCEVHDFECIWSRAYDCLKAEGREEQLLDHAPVIQDQALRGTSSWANMYLQRDHHGRQIAAEAVEKEPQNANPNPRSPVDDH